MDEEKQMREIIDNVILMRDSQKKFFKTRNDAALQDSKHYERKVDKLIEKFTSNQTEMF